MSKEVSDRSLQFLLPDGGAPSEADAVIYLMRWTHESDVRFLEPFAEDERAGRTPVNRVAVLSRADEIGSCKTDAMDVAARVAASWQRNPDLRRLCQSVVPVAGLVAQAGASLREDEYRALAALARLSAHERDAMLLSSDRFAALAVDTDISEHVRRELLRRLGLYGVRVAIQQISSGGAPTSSALAAALVSASGLDSLRCLLRDQFEFRAHVLKARSALLALDRILRLDNGSQARALLVETERIALGAHEIVEIGVLARLRSGELSVPDQYLEETERLLGGDGAAMSKRLAVPKEASSSECIAEAEAAATRFRRLANHPTISREVRETCDAVVRTCEGLLSNIT